MTVSNTSTQNSILIISQDVDMTRVWKNLFEQKNCRVISETTARDGVHAARTLSPTLIILDLDMPDKDRLDLCRDLRASTNGTLLLINASHKQVDVLEYHRAGVDETVSDSISPMALLVKSLAWLARQDWIVPRKQSAQLWA
ncbi:MAG TPA: response regulator [Anaerolineales bacterium]|nr:response regulator [Anaerolineales bacterium]HNE03446.1 response regulator [Anaerolineales bacterium]HNF94854.1 response regulator [Anaerolineales bacterium]HNH25727.1 response regulator [Anaerolineales bacterium]HNM36235.1 response regulator [Anaerolineales bacterium]